MGLQAGVGRLPGGVGGKHLGHVGFGAAVLPRLVLGQAFANHQFGRAHLRIGLGDGKLNALVLADGTPEHLALIGVVHRLADEPFGITDAFGSDQHALGIHAREDVAETLALFANLVLGRNLHVVEEHLTAVVIHHRADRTDSQAVAQHLPHIHDERGQAVGLFIHLVTRSSARQ
ncbi:hypothetical protein D9M68_709220 [compost metagenome]